MTRTTHDPLADDDTTATVFDRIVERLRHLRPASDGVGAAGDTDGEADGALLGQPIVVPDPPDELHVTDHRFAGFDLRSVGSFALKFFGCFVAMVLAGAVVLWALASVLGLVSAFEDFMDGIGFTGFHLLSLEFLLGLVLISAAIGAFMVGITLVFAGLYNVLASRWGGIRIFVSETGPLQIAESNGNGNGAAHGASAARAPRLRDMRRAPLRRVATPANGTRPAPERSDPAAG
jgi:hypothetical protein